MQKFIIDNGAYLAKSGFATDSEPKLIPNYISKSKLVEWDWLKLTIKDDWRFLYKQILPVERAHLIWSLSLEEWQYKVIAEWRIFKVILAAVTFLKLKVWDKLTIVVPQDLNSEWAAIDSIIPE